jgi:hypothetical protein
MKAVLIFDNETTFKEMYQVQEALKKAGITMQRHNTFFNKVWQFDITKTEE